ncbi:Chitin synthase, class 3 [Borealophlyctis nickersoniae]|nr:Chitin synthase, class 3 [Borealophlyctis nickersoniae]
MNELSVNGNDSQRAKSSTNARRRSPLPNPPNLQEVGTGPTLSEAIGGVETWFGGSDSYASRFGNGDSGNQEGKGNPSGLQSRKPFTAQASHDDLTRLAADPEIDISSPAVRTKSPKVRTPKALPIPPNPTESPGLQPNVPGRLSVTTGLPRSSATAITPTNPGVERGGSMGRRRTLARPERAVTSPNRSFLNQRPHRRFDAWGTFTEIVTCCIPSFFLSRFGKMHEKPVQKAWREKIALCMIILCLCTGVGFITYGFTATLCKQEVGTTPAPRVAEMTTKSEPNMFVIDGVLYNMTAYVNIHANLPKFATRQLDHSLITQTTGKDISPFFANRQLPDSCGLQRPMPFSCVTSQFPAYYAYCHDLTKFQTAVERYNLRVGPVVYQWDDVAQLNRSLVVYKDMVLDVSPYLAAKVPYFGDYTDDVLKYHLRSDVSINMAGSAKRKGTADCLAMLYKVGQLDVDSIGCATSNVILYLSLIIILGVVLCRFFFAIYFDWFISRELGKLQQSHSETKRLVGNRREILEGGKHPFPLKAGKANRPKDMQLQIDRTQSGVGGVTRMPSGASRLAHTRSAQRAREEAAARSRGDAGSIRSVIGAYESPYGKEVYTILLVTCYSEGESGLRATMDSLAETSYSDDHKLLFIVADGLIKGSGETRTTPEIVISMLEMDDNWQCPPEPVSYIAIADGSKRHNKAQVYTAWYTRGDRCIPTILVVKCGTEEEAKQAKPGNRGKRDSQIILMSFFKAVMFDEPMTPLHYDLFQKIHYLMGVTADQFEIVLMVDADTKVAPDSLSRMVACMVRDPLVMGLCGETRIANKKESWVSRIQVFEYYLSHHLHKAFESVFGGVTCLPGCFCMYRIKAPKGDGYWVPILCNPDIVKTYSDNKTVTLHKKNLLLLGEDRFLTTLMLGTFPYRKLIFVPRAFCKTVVPAQFKVLLSQRRRWINSTIHNLMELVLVRELCGIFCFSMQFIILLELIGTVVLPAAIVFTIILIFQSVFGTPQLLALLLLFAILGLPAVLILLTTRRRVYIWWMCIYIVALPIWNFVLPTYAFWHFDDFSWGQTRKVEGEEEGAGKGGHGEGDGKVVGPDEIVMKKWVDWETERRRRIRKEWQQNDFKGVLGSPLSWRASPRTQHLEL